MRVPSRILGGLVVVLVVAGVSAVALLRSPGITPTVALAAPGFVEEALAAGVDHLYGGGFRSAVGGGVAVMDCNADGRSDLYLAGGGNPAALYRNDSSPGGVLRFSLVSAPATDLIDVNGAYPLDIDSDGRPDLVILRNGENVLLRGLGDCRFERMNERWLVDGGEGMTFAFSAIWEGADAMPTLAFGNYRVPDESGEPGVGCADNELVRPVPAGTGYGPTQVLTPGYCTLSLLFSDWDRSGRRDLRVSNDRQYYDPANGQEQLWRLAAGEAPRLYTDADGWVPLQIEGMGIASRDLTADGLPEVYLTSQGSNRLQTLTAGPANPTYREVAVRYGVSGFGPYTGGDVRPSTAWHPEFADVNNDGFIDLFVSKGNVDQQAEYAEKDPSNLFLGQPDGTFVEGAEAAGIVSFWRGRGAALADFNLDGLLDLVVVNYKDRVLLYRNSGAEPAGHWLAIRLDQLAPNRDAIGSWIEVRVGGITLLREVTVGGGHAGGQLGWIHFGLGPAESASVRVQWPDGQTGPWIPVAADGFMTIQRGDDEAQEWSPAVD